MPRCKNLFEGNSFMDFVDKVMNVRDGMTIKKFCFKSSRYCNYDRVSALICTVLKSNIQVLDLQYFGRARGMGAKLPPELFMNCKALVVLKLSEHVLLDVNGPNVFFPSLKTLELRSVTYLDDASLVNLLPGCPVLEDMVVERCLYDGLDNMEMFNISGASLRRLTLFFGLCKHLCEGDDCSFKVMVNCPNLEYLSVSDHMSGDFVISSSLSSLVEAYIDIENDYFLLINHPNVYFTRVSGLIRETSVVKSLALSGVTLSTLAGAQGFNSPQFHNLVSLSLGVDDQKGWTLLPSFLQNMPNLDVLVFADGLVPPDFNLQTFPFQFNWNPLLNVPACLAFNLKTIRVNGFFAGMTEELKLIKYLLEIGKVLSTMAISGFKANPKI